LRLQWKDFKSRFMNAYLQGVCDYNDTLKDGRLAGPHAEEVVDAIARYSVTKDRDLIKSVIPPLFTRMAKSTPMALPNTSLFIGTLGLVKGNVAVTDSVDMSLTKVAAVELDPTGVARGDLKTGTPCQIL
jgi:NitT/TauT family transport system substrate-binding protein